MNRPMVIGLAAHVDAGKTTLSEAMLFLSGSVRKQGRVDHGDAFLDTDPMEKERGITIFSKQARLEWKKQPMILLDTPGHTDFSGETERALSVMDACVLVISAPEGIQAHTATLWNLLRKNRIPTVLFINKTDRFQGRREELLSTLNRKLSDHIVAFPEPDPEKIALCDEVCLDAYLREGRIPDFRLWRLIREGGLFPCFFGAALKNEGVPELLDFLAEAEITGEPGADFGALVYKIARDAQGARLSFMKITGGALSARDLLTLKTEDGEELWAEKAAEIRLYSGARYTAVPRAEAGELCAVVGLSKTRLGDALGAETGRQRPETTLRPCYACRVILPPKTDLTHALACLRAIEEEEPLIRVEYVESRREIRVQSMGEVYLDVLRRQILERFGLEISFGETGVLYRETVTETVEGVGHYEPLRHYAEVHLLLSPLPRGSGLEFATAVSTDDLTLNWQRLIHTHLREKVHAGVLTGSPITDMRITLIAGKAHLKHTEGGDFRQATYRALRQGLMKARARGQVALLEPWLRLTVAVPEENLGRVLTDLANMGGQPEIQESAGPGGDGMRTVTSLAPAGACEAWSRELRIFTRGKGTVAAAFDSWREAQHPEEIIRERGYEPTRDVWNTPDSVFCSHGAGVTVPWDQVEQYMHLPSFEEFSRRRREAADSPRPDTGRTASTAYRGTAEEDEALRVIFEKTYGPAKTNMLMRPVRKEAETEEAQQAGQHTGADAGKEILLVDGYNVLFAWEEWCELVHENIEGARKQLMDLMCNYAGVTGREVILVFDAYRVKDNPGRAEKYHNIYVIWTREAQTADAFIEKTTLLSRKEARIRVITSDRPEQLIALGNAAMRTSAREFHQEVAGVQGSIADFLKRNNRPATEKAMEKAYKEAWKEARSAEKSE